MTKQETVVGLATFQDLSLFLAEGNHFAFLVDSQGEVAYLAKEVFLNSRFALDALAPDTVVEVEVYYNPHHRRWTVRRVLALHQPESRLVRVVAPVTSVSVGVEEEQLLPYPVAQFGDLRPALDGGKHVNHKTSEELFGVYDPNGNLCYYVVAKSGAQQIDRVVDTTDLKLALKAIGKRLPAVRTKKVEVVEPAVATPMPSVEAAGSVVVQSRPAPVKHERPLTIKGFAGLAEAIQRTGNGTVTKH